MRVKLNLASHGDNIPGFINIDFHDQSADLHADVTNLPFPDNSAEVIYASHILEHMRMGDYEAALANPLNQRTVLETLAEWKRVLKPGGTLEIKVPDFNKCAHLYHQMPDWARAPGPDGIFPNVFYWLSGNGQHQAIFDKPTMEAVLRKAGFCNIQFLDEELRIEDRKSLETHVTCMKHI